MANYNLGRVAFFDKGVYSETETYNKWDFVTEVDSTYLFISDTPQIGTSVTDTTYWKCIADGKPSTLAAAAALVAKEQADTATMNANNAEDLRATAESGRVTAESGRVTAESGRVTAESGRVTSESGRVTDESGRGSNETTRQSNETTRVSNETTRQSNETTRKSNETTRQSNETTRQNNETTRQNQEASRVAAEAQRVASGSIIASQTNPQTLGSSSARLTKLWATDIDSVNMPTIAGGDLRTALGITFPQYFDIKAKGDGSGVLQMNITVLYAGTATITGGYFYTDITGTSAGTTTVSLVAGDNSIYMKTSSVATVYIPGLNKIRGSNSSGTNIPALYNIVFSPIINYCYIDVDNTVNGTLTIPVGCTVFIIYGNNIVSGALTIPSGCTIIGISGSNTVSYNLINTPNATKYIILNSANGGNYTYNTSSGQKTWGQNMREVYIRPKAGVWTSAMTDALLIDLSAGTTWTGEKIIDLRGNCGARTSASDSAVSTLQGNGVTVLTN